MAITKAKSGTAIEMHRQLCKAKLEAIANGTVILLALITGYVGLGRYMANYRVSRWVRSGDHLATIPNLDWKKNRHTLLLALNTGCRFCEESTPFYQILANVTGTNDIGIVAVFPNESERVRQFMTHARLDIPCVAAVPLEKLHVNGTPTLILVDADGRVERTWIGTLRPSEQLELLQLASGSKGCSAAELAQPESGGKDGCNISTKAETKN